LLARYVPPDEDWDRHSEVVGLVSARLAGALAEAGFAVDTRFAAVAGLLHDIGRSRTQDPALHGVAGYQILRDLGYAEYALICLTHVLKGRSLREAYDSDVMPRGILPDEVEPRVSPLTVEHQIVAVADAMVLDTRVVGIGARYKRSKARYPDAFIRDNERLSLGLQAELEWMLGTSLTCVLTSGAAARPLNPATPG
jgi:putative nucleotidyltransferase with HDIG domain